jgi:hypothetical protein
MERDSRDAPCCCGRNSWAAGFPLLGHLRTARTFSLSGNGSSRAVACLADTLLEAPSDIRPRIPEEAPFMIDALSFQNLGGKGSASVYDGVCRQSGCRTLDASIFPSSAH